MNNALIILLISVPAIFISLYVGREHGRREAFVRGVVYGYRESLENDMKLNPDGAGGIHLTKDKCELMRKGLIENENYVNLKDYERYYDASLLMPR